MLARSFEKHRPRLRGLAYRMLGSQADADDAIQVVWQRLSRGDTTDLENLGGWLNALVAHVCLNMMRTRTRRSEQPRAVHLAGPAADADGPMPPEEEARLAATLGLALLAVLDTLTPDERLAFVLHDMFRLPLSDIAAALGSSQASASQLADRARSCLQAARRLAEPDLAGPQQGCSGRSVHP